MIPLIFRIMFTMSYSILAIELLFFSYSVVGTKLNTEYVKENSLHFS